jgi:hypothetical protein
VKGLANKYYPLKEIKVGTNVYKQIPLLKALRERERSVPLLN